MKRVFPPLNTTDYAPYIQQLPAPNKVDGYFWVVGGTGTGPSLKAYESAYGKVAPKKFVGNLFFFFQSGFDDVAPRLVGAYVRRLRQRAWPEDGSGEAVRGDREEVVRAERGSMSRTASSTTTTTLPTRSSSGLRSRVAHLGRALDSSLPRSIKAGYQVSDGGQVQLDSNRQAIAGSVPAADRQRAGRVAAAKVVGFVPNVDQSFGGLFKKTCQPPGRSQPACVKHKLPWAGQDQGSQERRDHRSRPSGSR